MTLLVREMLPSEAHVVTSYFHNSTPEFLENMGVDPTRIPTIGIWQDRIAQQYALPPERRAAAVVLWLMEDKPVGFSSCDKIVYGEHATMHLHVLQPERRQSGIGTPGVRQSAAIYFDMLKLKSLFCEPNAFNIAPNRTLQKAGFKYLKTHMTVPGPLNYHQAVTRWMVERPQMAGWKT
jgi:RimJ/RimL family protein N-acetyltransferase